MPTHTTSKRPLLARKPPVISGPASAGDPRSEPDAVAKGMAILSYLLGGLIFYGGLGWLGAHFLHLDFLLPIGIVVGIGLSLYLIIVRYGNLGSGDAAALVAKRQADRAEWARRAGRPMRDEPGQDEGLQDGQAHHTARDDKQDTTR